MSHPQHTTICREGWYYLVLLGIVLGGAMLHDVNLLLLLGGMLAGPALFSWRAVAVALRDIEVTRELPDGVCAGDLLVGNLLLKNGRRKAGSWGVVAEDHLQRETTGWSERAIGTGVVFPHVPAGQTRKGMYRGRLPRRGRYRVGPLRLSTRFPFGLLQRTVTLGQVDRLTVYPRLGRLTQRWVARHRPAPTFGCSTADPLPCRFTYFELDRSGTLWRQLKTSSGFALHIAGEFPGLEMEFWAIKGA